MRWNLALAGLAVLWGLISLIAVDERQSALVLVFARVVFAAAAIGIGARVLGRGELLHVREQRGRLALAGVALAVHWLTFFGAIKLSSIAVGNLTTYTAPVVLAVVAPFLLPERRSLVAAAAIVPAAAGLILVALAGGEAHATGWGIAVGLLSALSLAAVVIFTKQLGGLHPITILFWSYVVIAVVTAPALPFAGRLVPNGRELTWLLVLGLVFTAGSGYLYYVIMRHVTAQAAGALMYLEPVSAAFLGWIVLGQQLGWQIVLGGALVLAGGLLVVIFEPADVGTVPGVTQPPDRNLALELVRVTEAAALGAARWVGRGEKEAADQAAVDGMRTMLDTVAMDGVVVIGEGEKDAAPMLFNGEAVGNGHGPSVDVAVDPLDGTRLTSVGQPNAIAVIAVAERGTMFFPGAAVYMEKLAVGPEAAGAIDLEAGIAENARRVAKAKRLPITELSVIVLDRPRNEPLIAELRTLGVKVKLVPDGDVAPAIAAAAWHDSGVDLLAGIGGTPEGVISAAALKCAGGAIQGRLWPRDEAEAEALREAGFDVTQVLTTDDLVGGEDVFVAVTGVTSGALLHGVRSTPEGAVTDSLVMRSRSGTIRRIEARHAFEKLSRLSGIDYR